MATCDLTEIHSSKRRATVCTTVCKLAGHLACIGQVQFYLKVPQKSQCLPPWAACRKAQSTK